MTETFLGCAGCACPILGTDAISGLSFSSDILNIPISISASVCVVSFMCRWLETPSPANVSLLRH